MAAEPPVTLRRTSGQEDLEMRREESEQTAGDRPAPPARQDSHGRRDTAEPGGAFDRRTSTISGRSGKSGVSLSRIQSRQGTGSSGAEADSKRFDLFSSLSALGSETLFASSSNHHEARSLPLLLTAFVCAIAALCGIVVAGVHLAMIYSGCPLGINGCNEFHGKASKGYKLLHWVNDTFNGEVPEAVVYLVVAVVGGLLYSISVIQLPGYLAWQVSGGGTMQSLVAVASGDRIPLEVSLVRTISTSLYLGSGGTLGGEGPAIQVCTTCAMFMGWCAGIRSRPTQSLLACIGISCGFAASFNSPLAGILFAMEELQHVSPSLSKGLISCVLVASVVASTTTRACHGNSQMLHAHIKPDMYGDGFGTSMWMLIAVPIAIVCSVVGAAITLLMRHLNCRLERYFSHIPYWALFVLQAMLTAGIGAAVFHGSGFRGVWGIGMSSLQEAFDGGAELDAWTFLIPAAGKALAMVLAVSVRAPGDILEPVLISGGFIGAFVGRLLSYVLTLPVQDIMNPCIIFGMVSLFASCFRFPLTPVVIVFELTGISSYGIILPTALASFTAFTASDRLCLSMLDEIMEEDGVDLQALSADMMGAEAHKESQPAEEGEDATSPQQRERRPSRLFCIEELLNEASNRRPAAGYNPSSPTISVSAAAPPVRPSSPLYSPSTSQEHVAQMGIGQYRARSGSVTSLASSASSGNGPPGPLRPAGPRERSNSVTSAASRTSGGSGRAPAQQQQEPDWKPRRSSSSLGSPQPPQQEADWRPRRSSSSLGSPQPPPVLRGSQRSSSSLSLATASRTSGASGQPAGLGLRANQRSTSSLSLTLSRTGPGSPSGPNGMPTARSSSSLTLASWAGELITAQPAPIRSNSQHSMEGSETSSRSARSGRSGHAAAARSAGAHTAPAAFRPNPNPPLAMQCGETVFTV